MKKFTFFCLGLLSALSMQAQIILVPGPDSLTIQEGINAATPGDTILVAEGTYYEQINFLGKKPLTVASEFLIDGDTSHISKTIIDGSQITSVDNASVVNFISGEDSTSILCGFTIRHGKGTFHIMGAETFRSGGGVYVYASGAKIIHNHITDNHLNDTLHGDPQYLDGAGIAIMGDSPDWVVVDNNVIDYNSCYASQSLGSRTPGICAFDHNCSITNNTISWNTATADGNANAIGGAFGAYSPLMYQYTIKVRNNILSHNLVRNFSTLLNSWATWACGGFQNVTGIFTGNSVEYNESSAESQSHLTGGGAVTFLNPGQGSIVLDNTFRANTNHQWGGALEFGLWQSEPDRQPLIIENNYFINNEGYTGGAINSMSIPVLLINNVFSGNHAAMNGGAIYLMKSFSFTIHHFATLINNSFSGNKAELNGGGVYTTSVVKPLIINSIFKNDTAFNTSNEIYLYNGIDTVKIAYSNIDTSFISGNGFFRNGGGNINSDPLFTDPDSLTIPNNSPCINTGILSYTCQCGDVHNCPPYDILGKSRPWYDYPDLGAYEFHPGSGIGPELSGGAGLDCSSRPNPVTTSATICYTLVESCHVTVTVYNSFGQLAGRLVNGYQQKGEQKVVWNAETLPAGMYYFRIEAEGMAASEKVIKM